MHQASKVGGCLGNLKWWHFAVTNHDFLMAAIILSLDLVHPEINAGQNGGSLADEIARPTKLYAVELSREIWKEIVDVCRDAKRAVRILTAVLGKLTYTAPLDGLGSGGLGNINQPTQPALNVDLPRVSSNFGIDQQLVGEDSPMPIAGGDVFLTLLESEFSLPADFDWKAWDQFLAGQSHTQPQQADLYLHPEFQGDPQYVGNTRVVTSPTWLS